MKEIIPYKTATKRYVYIVTDDGFIYPNFQTFPIQYGIILNYFIGIINTPTKISEILQQIKEHRERKENKEMLGGNETLILVQGNETTFDAQYISGYEPLKITTDEAIKFFEGLKDWLLKYESGKIKGIEQPSDSKFKIIGGVDTDKYQQHKDNGKIKLITNEIEFEAFKKEAKTILYFQVNWSGSELSTRQKYYELLDEYKSINFYMINCTEEKKVFILKWLEENGFSDRPYHGGNGETFFINKTVRLLNYPFMLEKSGLRYEINKWENE